MVKSQKNSKIIKKNEDNLQLNWSYLMLSQYWTRTKYLIGICDAEISSMF